MPPDPNASDLRRQQQQAQQEIARCRSELRSLYVQIGLDAAGTIDPTPISDLAGAGYSIWRGDFIGAGLSLIGIIPYIGDSLGKSAKAARIARRIASVKRRLARALETLKVARSRILRAQRMAVVRMWRRSRFYSLYRRVPLLRNPRRLAKHPGPITPKRLTTELRRKGFVQVKRGKHAPQGMLEDSDIYLRRVVGRDGKEYFEAVRIDRRLPNPNLNRGVQKSPAQIQMGDKLRRQEHHLLRAPEVPSQRQVVSQMQSGKAFKGDFTHWHHEAFPATPENLRRYLQPPRPGQRYTPPEGLVRFDPTGRPVGGARNPLRSP